MQNPSLLALDGFDLNTVHKLSSNEKISWPRFALGAAGCKARTPSIVLRGPPFNEIFGSTFRTRVIVIFREVNNKDEENTLG